MENDELISQRSGDVMWVRRSSDVLYIVTAHPSVAEALDEVLAEKYLLRV